MGGFKEEDDDFVDTILAWTLEDVHNPNLFGQLEKIPDSFDSVKSYLGSFRYPLLEETRAQVLSSIQLLNRAPFAEVVSFEETSPRGTKTYHLTVDYWRKRYNDHSKELYQTLPGDLLLITTAKVETSSDLGRLGRSWSFLSVTNITEDFENEAQNGVGSKYFNVKGSKELDMQFDDWSSLSVIYLTNTISYSRAWKALTMERNSKILTQILHTDYSLADSDLAPCLDGNENVSYDSFLGCDLNVSQQNAVLACLPDLKCKKKSDFDIIWGPPATGKTKTVAALLLGLLRTRFRALVCAPTNVATIEVASQVMKMIQDSEPEESLCSFGDMLLFDHKGRHKVESNSVVEEISLEHRVLRLGECFGPVGLIDCIKSDITFLEGFVSQHSAFLESEVIIETGGKEHYKDKHFVKNVRERFIAIVKPLRDRISIFCTYMPKSILGRNFQDMMLLLEYLDSLEVLLFTDYFDSQQPHKFSSDLEEPSDSVAVRTSCLRLLISIQTSLHELELPSHRNTEIISLFCLKRASLVFCTVSSSYKFHTMGIEPMNVLIIDEAAQVKECESIIPLQLPGVSKVVIVGDECQLRAAVTSKMAKEAHFGRSLFERLISQNHPKHVLNVQYRMHPSISSFPNSQFYHNKIEDSDSVKKKSYGKQYLQGPMFGSYSFLNVTGRSEGKDDDEQHRKNMVEIAIVLRIVKMLHKAWLESGGELSVGIVSPYAAQVESIQEKLVRKFDGSDRFQVKATTVDGFQGGEADIIILSTVRLDCSQSLEFISDPGTVNVALTRARHCLWFLGNESTLTNSQSIWDTLVLDAKNRGCFYNADDDKDLAKTILRVKKEQDQFGDLLHSDSVVFKNSKWKVLFSDDFLKSFKKLTSTRDKKSVLNLLLKLSGGWRPKRQVLASGGEGFMDIMKFRVEGLNVVCTVDIQKDSKYVQVLKIWDILAPDDMSKLVERLEGIFGKYADEYIRLCKEKSIERDLEVPRC